MQDLPPGLKIMLLLVFTLSGLFVVGPILFLLLMSVTGDLPADIEDMNSLSPAYTYASAFLGLLGIFIMGFWLFMKLTKQKADDLILRSPFQMKFVLISVGGLALMWFGAEYLYQLNRAGLELIPNSGFFEMEEQLNAKYAELFSPANISYYPLALFIFAMVPAFVEELVFRGLLMRYLNETSNGNFHFAVIVSSLLFAGFHWQPWNILPMVGLAILFGYVYHYSKDIRYSMLMHFLYNGVQVTLMFFVPGAIA